MERKRSLKWQQTVAVSAAGALVICGYFFWYATHPQNSYEYRHRGHYAKGNLHAVQLAIEEYAQSHGGTYPASLTELLASGGRLRKLPANPYTPPGWAGALRDEQAAPLPEVPLGRHLPGGVTYVPLTVDIHDGQSDETRTEVSGYALLVYGDRAVASEPQRTALPHGAELEVAWEYVLMVLDSGWRIQARSGAE